MNCPHCRVHIHPAFRLVHLGQDPKKLGQIQPVGKEVGVPTVWQAGTMACPSCHVAIVKLVKHVGNTQTPYDAYPRATTRVPAPPEVPKDIAEDYNEAAAVIEDSPKASAALSRRCVQAVLRSAGYKQHDLSKAIDAALGSNSLPDGLAGILDAVRNIGNFAAHPVKDTNTGEIVPVEPEEAEWNLEVLDAMFDFFYVQPARNKERTAKLNAKLAEAGKPPMKQPPG